MNCLLCHLSHSVRIVGLVLKKFCIRKPAGFRPFSRRCCEVIVVWTHMGNEQVFFFTAGHVMASSRGKLVYHQF